VQAPDIRERYLIASFDGKDYALQMGGVERVVPNPTTSAWEGRGEVRAYAQVAGWIVWLLDPGKLFVDHDHTVAKGEWLLILKDELGLTRLGCLADDVRGPVSESRLHQIKRLHRRSLNALVEPRG